MTVSSFRIDVPQATLDDLRDRLARTRWPDEAQGARWEYGASLGYMREFIAHWKDHYDWRAQEAALNEFSHFHTTIDGVGIHFIYERGKGTNPKPLLLLHGWPDSFYRFHKVIPMLTDPERFGGSAAESYDVIVPSLPGFGFSDPTRTRGGVDSAALLGKLVTEVLGYTRFGVHGGDTGSPIAQQIARNLPEAVTGVHLTDIGYDSLFLVDRSTASPEETEYFAHTETWMNAEGAYISVQGTKPQNLAYGLNDSPVALAGWILDKFYAWGDTKGDLESRFSKDEMITNLMIYWVTETINSSMRAYYDGFHAEWGGSEGSGEGEAWSQSDDTSGAENGSEADGATTWQTESGTGASSWGSRLETPAGVALFPADNPPPRALAERFLNIQRFSLMPTGGHFAALEEPELLVSEIRAFFGQVEQGRKE